MWLEQLTLVLLSVSLVISDPIPVVLDEEPRIVKVPLGSSVAFQCRLKTKSYNRLRVLWRFSSAPCSNDATVKAFVNDTIFEKKTFIDELNRTQPDSRDEDREGTWRTFVPAKAEEQQGGCYYCEIRTEIPELHTTESRGTELVIITETGIPAWWMWISLGVASVLMVVLLLICVSLSRRRCRRRGEEPVYANTRPVTSKQPSPRPGSDHLKEPSCPQNIQKPSPSRKYNEGKRRYK
ncbi:uncharacterized protein ACO6RY_18217 [Pungitius sinensis]